MTPTQFAIEPLDRQHDRSGFDCGEAALDRYFRQQARQDANRFLAAVFVLRERETDRIAGFYTLSALSVECTDFPEETARKLPRYPIPVTLLGRLAVDRSFQGQRLGKALLFDALQRAYRQREQIGAMAVVVDAKHDAARAFYEAHEFRRFPAQPYRLFLPMGTIGMLAGQG